MKKSDVKVGMKVFPLRKTIGIPGIGLYGLYSSSEWEKAIQHGHAFLYVIRIDEDKLSLSWDKKSLTGDWFLPEDVEPYSWRKHRKLVFHG